MSDRLEFSTDLPRRRPFSLLFAASLCLVGILFAGLVYGADAGVQLDPAPALKLGPAVAPVLVSASSGVAPVDTMLVQTVVAAALGFVLLVLRRFTPQVKFFQGQSWLWFSSFLASALTTLSGAYAHGGVSWRVTLVGLLTIFTSAMAQLNGQAPAAGNGALQPLPLPPPPLPPKAAA